MPSHNEMATSQTAAARSEPPAEVDGDVNTFTFGSYMNHPPSEESTMRSQAVRAATPSTAARASDTTTR